MIAIWIVIALFAVSDSAAGLPDQPAPPRAVASVPAPATPATASAAAPRETAP
jgi:hypothetical protein